MLTIPEIKQILDISPHADRNRSWKQQRRRRKVTVPNQPVKDNYEVLTDIVHDLHQELVRKNFPYRFCVYEHDDEVFIDVIAISPDGKTETVHHQNISDDEFLEWIDVMQTGSGFVLSHKV